MLRSRPAGLPFVLLLLVACGSDNAGTPASDGPVPTPDAAVAARCDQYPIHWPADPAARAEAAAELARLSEDAQALFNGYTGTVAEVSRLDLPVPGCIDGADVNVEVAALLAAHPALFQMDPSEWRAGPPFDCRRVTDEVPFLLVRERLASHPLVGDSFLYSVKRVDGVVHLTGVTRATYLPAAYPGLDEIMTSCIGLTAGQADATARVTPLPFIALSQCFLDTDSHTYVPRDNDTFMQLSVQSELWHQQLAIDGVVLSGTRTVRVTVNPANYTEELLNSNARCPADDPDSDAFTVGFNILFDVHSGQILGTHPGITCDACGLL